MALGYGAPVTNSGTSASPTSGSFPSTSLGDGLVAYVSSDGGGAHTGPGGGWTQIGSQANYEGLRLSVWFLACDGTESGTASWGIASTDWFVGLIHVLGNGGTAAVAASGTDDDTGGDPSPSATAGADDMAVAFATDAYSADPYGAISGWTEAFDLDVWGSQVGGWYQTGLSAGSTTINISSGGGTETHGYIVILEDTGPSASAEQASFRFYDDDADPTTATALAGQDTAITGRAVSTPTQVRVGIQATGDPAAEAYRLQYRVVGDDDVLWEDV